MRRILCSLALGNTETVWPRKQFFDTATKNQGACLMATLFTFLAMLFDMCLENYLVMAACPELLGTGRDLSTSRLNAVELVPGAPLRAGRLESFGDNASVSPSVRGTITSCNRDRELPAWYVHRR